MTFRSHNYQPASFKIDRGRILAASQLAFPTPLRVLPQEPDIDHMLQVTGAPPTNP